jgi:hypothetical protein
MEGHEGGFEELEEKEMSHMIIPIESQIHPSSFPQEDE